VGNTTSDIANKMGLTATTRSKSGGNIYRLLAAILLVASLKVKLTKAQNCIDICGKFEKVKEEDAQDKILSESGNEMKQIEPGAEGMDSKARKGGTGMSHRIVHGYAPPLRGFIAAIKMRSKADWAGGRDYFSCGGTLINDKYVLTAGHCVCQFNSKEPHTATPCSEDGKIQYSPRQNIRVFVGVTPGEDFKILDWNDARAKKVRDVKVHPMWKGQIGKEPLKDIALIKLHRKYYVEFTEEIRPVCLPSSSEHFEVKNKFAYAAGWGHTEEDQSSVSDTRYTNCFTDNRGPARNAKCRFPFTHYASPDMQLQECLKDKNSFPSNNGKCLQFREMNDINFEWRDLNYVEIRYNRKYGDYKKTHCFSDKNIEKYGWCGVCIETAKEGEMGYCDNAMQNNAAEEGRLDTSQETKDKEVTIVQPRQFWGYCSEQCGEALDMNKKATLKETMLTILTDEECLAFAKASNDNNKGLEDPFTIENELCAGMKFNFPKYEIYNRSYVGKKEDGKNQYRYTLVGTDVDKLDGTPELQKLGFYLGFSDTCTGDSGGPLYQFVDGRVIQVGVVSRGIELNCAGQNKPGVYTSLINKETLEWVQRKSGSGKCPPLRS